MLERHVREKLALYAESSVFACDDGCSRYGCRSGLVVTASLVELLFQARFTGSTVLDLFDRAYSLAPAHDGAIDRVRIRLALRKPCPFLEDERTCGIYAVRPAVCALFPEYLYLFSERIRQAYIGQNGLAAYPCVAAPMTITAARKEALGRLMAIHEAEVLATEVHLFGLAGFTVDLREDALALCDGRGRVTCDTVASALDRRLAACGVDERVREKLVELETAGPEGCAWSLGIAESLRQGGH